MARIKSSMRILFSSVLLVLSFTSATFAQNANFAWWSNPSLVQDLQLSEQQQRKIRETVHSFRPRLVDARGETQKAEGDLLDLLNDERFDSSRAKEVVEKVTKARADSTRVFTEMSLNLRTILTLPQWRELVKRWGEIRKNRRPSDTSAAP